MLIVCLYIDDLLYTGNDRALCVTVLTHSGSIDYLLKKQTFFFLRNTKGNVVYIEVISMQSIYFTIW